MPKVKSIEKKIWDVEGFAVNLISADGKNIRSDKNGLPQYSACKASRNSWTVAEWRRKKFSQQYPGLDIEILDGNGENVDGKKSLGKVRDSYCDDEE